MKEQVWVSLGSNLGDRLQNLSRALAMMNEKDLRVLRKSSVYESDPQGYEAQGKFYNAAAEFSTVLQPEETLAILQGIELALGRKREIRWGPRTIDLDILLFGQRVIDAAVLTVPHPALAGRSFVLCPLAELAPDLLIPGLGSVSRLLPLCPSLGIEKILSPDQW